MKRIAIDMDGVLADVYHQFFKMDEAEFGQRRKLQDVEGKPEREGFPHIMEYVNTKGFFRTAPLIAGCVPIVKEINQQYDLYIVSAAMEFPLSLPEKLEWLAEHFPFITWQQIVFCGSKQIIRADIMIDDHFRNLDSFTGDTSLLFSQPHNIQSDPGRHQRVNNWEEISKILL
ncbi:5'(3')-deoxyribonucleotidase [Terrimonas sp. NA20]|uniref:5'(3')-deoxyribonucleotidase n=1 Tax=Terrimonas ginsenosidimutans TaxID=2908004 RepID=A0ABS9KXS7_9BACT|nr:5'(3')-deoxyribonucleotidase [Terrimonas ginsenosidimutans]MCG2617120.1 5'(3')-deoxyribonucleotidase [Terrimonas ginsenosidimutans]